MEEDRPRGSLRRVGRRLGIGHLPTLYSFMDATEGLQLACAAVESALAALRTDGWRDGVITTIGEPNAEREDALFNPRCTDGEMRTVYHSQALVCNLNKTPEAYAADCADAVQMLRDAAAKNLSISVPNCFVRNGWVYITFTVRQPASAPISVRLGGDVTGATFTCMTMAYADLEKAGWRRIPAVADINIEDDGGQRFRFTPPCPSTCSSDARFDVLLSPATPTFDPTVPFRTFTFSESMGDLAQEAGPLQLALNALRGRMLCFVARCSVVVVPHVTWDGQTLSIHVGHH